MAPQIIRFPHSAIRTPHSALKEFVSIRVHSWLNPLATRNIKEANTMPVKRLKMRMNPDATKEMMENHADIYRFKLRTAMLSNVKLRPDRQNGQIICDVSCPDQFSLDLAIDLLLKEPPFSQ